MKNLLLICLGCLFLAGCGAVSSETTIAADGSFERRIVAHVANYDGMPNSEAPAPEDMIELIDPEGWKTEAQILNGITAIVATRSFAPGQTEQAGFSMVDEGDPYIICVLDIRKRADGMIEYTETYSWVGELPDMGIEDEQMIAFLGKHLKPIGASDEDIQKISMGAIERVWPKMFGPEDTLMPEMLVNFNLVQKKMMRVMGKAILDTVEEVMPDASSSERLTAVRAIVIEMNDQSMMQNSAESIIDNPMEMPAEEEEEDDTPEDMFGVSTSVIGPGKLVETNGEYDPITGEVFWSFYAMAAARGPVVLKAVFDPSG